MRPADANEVVEAWRVILPLQHQPVALILSRQALPTVDRTRYAAAAGVAQGAYVLADAPGGAPDVLLLATGSEVSLCVEAYERLAAAGVKARVVSMPSWDLFERQPQEYRDRVIPPARPGARLGGAGLDVRLGALYGHRRRPPRHGDLRRLGAAEGAAPRSSASPSITSSPRPRPRSPARVARAATECGRRPETVLELNAPRQPRHSPIRHARGRHPSRARSHP